MLRTVKCHPLFTLRNLCPSSTGMASPFVDSTDSRVIGVQLLVIVVAAVVSIVNSAVATVGFVDSGDRLSLSLSCWRNSALR